MPQCSLGHQHRRAGLRPQVRLLPKVGDRAGLCPSTTDHQSGVHFAAPHVFAEAYTPRRVYLCAVYLTGKLTLALPATGAKEASPFPLRTLQGSAWSSKVSHRASGARQALE